MQSCSHKIAIILISSIAASIPTATHAELWLTAATNSPQTTAANETIRPPAPPVLNPDGMPPEKVEADVSAHHIEVTAGFTGHEIVVFGSVDHSRQPTPESGYYDVAVIVEGPPVPVIARSKSNVGGLWINTGSMLFDAVPSFYAVSTTRPLEEIADANVLKEKSIGFIGRSLFRTSMRLPANVPVGALQAHVYLFREGTLISSFTSPVKLERRGVEAFIHRFAMRHSFLYGLATVLLAVGAGLAAATVFRRG